MRFYKKDGRRMRNIIAECGINIRIFGNDSIASLTSRWSIDTFPRAEKNHRYPHNQEGRVFQAAMAERGLKVRGPRSA